MKPPKVNYVRKGPIIVLKNTGGVRLFFGASSGTSYAVSIPTCRPPS
jgi:hypothetical protein